MCQDEEPAYRVRNSPIHGTGVFASRNIEQGEAILQYLGEVIDKNESTRRGNELMERTAETDDASVYIFILNAREDIDGDVDYNDAKFINHTCEPNCEAQTSWEEDEIWIYALRDIKKGEELGFDYGFEIEHFEDHPCRCGSDKCVGYIVSREQWPELEKQLKKKRKKEEKKKKEKAEAKKKKKKKKAKEKKKKQK